MSDAVESVSEMIKFASQSFEVKQPHDYKEFLQMSIVFLDDTASLFTFKKPGAFHYKCWMSCCAFGAEFWNFCILVCVIADNVLPWYSRRDLCI